MVICDKLSSHRLLKKRGKVNIERKFKENVWKAFGLFTLHLK